MDQDEASGRLIAGRYRLRAPIGTGGMSEVWEAYDTQLDRRVVVKQLIADRPSIQLQAESLQVRQERFLREVRATAAIEHPGIPSVYDAGVDVSTKRLFLVMQLLRGRDLQTLIDETDHGAAPVPAAGGAAIGAQIAAVLHEVHRHDIVHRDIKPANLMLTPGGIVKVLDFGVAALLGSGSNPRLTQVGMTVGTPPYMSPEQSLANAVGSAADVYALACVLYQLLTGRPPFNDSDGKSYQWHHVHSVPPPIRLLRPDVSAAVEDLLARMLTKDIESRPDAAAVYEGLRPYARTDPACPFPMDIAELDPCLPFDLPLGGMIRARITAVLQLEHAGAVPEATAATARTAGPPVTDREVEQIGEQVESLLRDQQFAQAEDLISGALARAGDAEIANELTFRLANVLYLGGSFTEAAALFEKTAGYFSRRYGPYDGDAHVSRYFLARCRDQLGEVTAAIKAFQDVAVVDPAPGDPDAIGRYLDTLASLTRLHAAAQQPVESRAAATKLRDAIIEYQGGDPNGLAEIEAYRARLNRLLGGRLIWSLPRRW